MPRYFHRTNAAQAIERDGFKDGDDVLIRGQRFWPGVWISDVPLDENEGAHGEYVFGIDLHEPPEQYEVTESRRLRHQEALPGVDRSRRGRQRT